MEMLDVQHYRARIEPDVAAGSVAGIVSIDFLGNPSEAVFDAGELEIESVELKGLPLPFTREGTKLRITLPRRDSRQSTVVVRYRGTPRYGLEFHPERKELYTIFSTSQWMVSVDDPSERATLVLDLVLPPGMVVAASGRRISEHRQPDGKTVHRWRLTEPAPAFTYGFAAGHYTRTHSNSGGRTLHYLSSDMPVADLHRVFANTGRMIEFFERRAGTALKGDYTQVLVSQTVGQEAAGLALLSEEYGGEVLKEQSAEGLIAHEVAHQWWGVSVTCKDWGHFWLNEGFATFMAAEYLADRYGRDKYDEHVQKWKARWEKLKESGNDHPLVYAQWSKPSTDDRAVVYQKGAYFLHRLRLEVGEDTFWRGIRRYTRKHAGGSVHTNDLKVAMSAAAGRDLSTFFDEWTGTAGVADPESQVNSLSFGLK